ncbi:hypothetical protein ACA910_020392 [Epithemia clementina (nom. ined.)]
MKQKNLLTKRKAPDSILFALETFTPHKKHFGQSVEDAHVRIDQDGSLVVSVLLDIEDALTKVGAMVNIISRDREFLSPKTRANVDALFLKINRIRTEMGDRDGTLPKLFQAPTIWGVIGLMAEPLASTIKDFSSYSSLRNEFELKVQALESKAARLEKEKSHLHI